MAYFWCEGKKHIIVLLGPTRSGKATFVQTSRFPSSTFLSTEDKLREGNYFSPWRETNMTNIKEYCHDLISKTFRDFQTSESDPLILDCVKDLEDAEFVAAQAKKHGLSITRALLFDVDEKQLERQCQERAKNTDELVRMMHDCIYEYLYKWKKKSNDLLNYYTKLKLLSKIPSPLSWRWDTSMSIFNYLICYPPSNLQFMLLECNQIKNVFMSLQSVLNVSQFQFTLPTSFVHSHRDVKWVANPTRYYVTAKADGVRCLLLKISGGAYLITRKNEIYPCRIADDQLPENTVLDGELLPSTSMSEIHPKMNTFQLETSVFLAFDALAVSGDILWKWPFRLRLESLDKLSIRKDIVAVMKQASADDQSSGSHESSPNKKKLTVHCAIKGHRQSTPDDIQTCLDTEFPYSCDGLIFTPDKAYAFGPDPLMFKWQSEDDVHCDIRLNCTEKNVPDSCYATSLDHGKSEVFECRWKPATRFHHPTNSFSFDELLPNLDELVQLGKVEKTVDLETSLEIFSYCSSASFSNSMMVRLSCGLVLHPPSKTVVTRPFVRIYEDVSNHDRDEVVEATVKYDGSLGIAFLWNGDVMVATKRRMDSEQAVWAKQWIKEHCNLSEFQAGYTYLCEIIYQNNTVVVNYLFEGLVLLAITDESGYELPYEEALHCARAIGFFMIAPRITGAYSEILWYCAGIESSQETATPNWPPFSSGALPVNQEQQEGWVVKFNDGSRQKIVYKWWKNLSELGHFIHPQVVWLLLKHDKINDVFGNAPSHFKAEIRRMVQAIGRNFEETLRLVERCLRNASSDGFVYSLCDDDEWWGYKKDDETNDLQQNKEFVFSINDSERNNDRLRHLLTELKPYRHTRRTPSTQFMNARPLLVYRDPEIQPVQVNLSPFYHSWKPNFLRLPILNYICLASPELEGYEPGDNFKNTWCKGWKRLSMTDQRWFVRFLLQRTANTPPFLQLPVEIITMILSFLDHKSLFAMSKVCFYLLPIVKSWKTRAKR